MIYRNDNIEITDEYVKGSIKDLMEYFRYEIASQSMSGKWLNEDIFENYSNNIHNIIDLLDNLYEDLINNIYTENDIMKVSEHPMGGFVIEKESDK